MTLDILKERLTAIQGQYMCMTKKRRKDLKKLIKDCGDAEKILETHDWNDTEEDAIEEVIDDIMADFDYSYGIGSAGYEEASNYIPDFFEYYRVFGKKIPEYLNCICLRSNWHKSS